jgi:ATP phosphoribosyltransferase
MDWRDRVQVKIALPKGELQERTATLMGEAGFAIDEYSEGSRSYRPQCEEYPGLFTKVFQEKDIAIQLAIGNYDLGICRLDWVEELLVKYHSDALVKIADLGYGKRSLYAAVAGSSGDESLESLKSRWESLRIVSEYPNLSESFALKQRLRRFQIFPAWGAVGVYPPENAEMAVMTATSPDRLRVQGLVPVASVLESSACLVANRNSLECKDLSRLLATLSSIRMGEKSDKPAVAVEPEADLQRSSMEQPVISIALPDGHQRPHTVDLLNRAGLELDGYNTGKPVNRPRIALNRVMVKVVRPQDMPLHVANGNFDLAITGKDWLLDHRFRFPSSPVEELLELGFGRVRIVAVVTQDMPGSSTVDLRKLNRTSALRVASEYTNIADKYVNDNHLTPCKIIPTWGASEAFLPEDADVLIENTETGSTIAKHKLKIIDTLFESCACLIGNPNTLKLPDKSEKASQIIDIIRRGLESRPVT